MEGAVDVASVRTPDKRSTVGDSVSLGICINTERGSTVGDNVSLGICINPEGGAIVGDSVSLGIIIGSDVGDMEGVNITEDIDKLFDSGTTVIFVRFISLLFVMLVFFPSLLISPNSFARLSRIPICCRFRVY